MTGPTPAIFLVSMNSLPRRNTPIGWQTASLALAVTALWGGNVVALKICLATVPPLWSAFWRFGVGLVTVVLLAQFNGIRLKPQPGEAKSLSLLGLLFAMQIAALNMGVNFTSPAYGVVLLNSHPVLTNFTSHFFVPEDRLSLRRMFGLTIAFAGICYLAMGRPQTDIAPRPILGNLLVLFSAALLAVRTVHTQHLVQTMEPVRLVVWEILFALPYFLASGLLFEPMLHKPLSADPILALLYQGVVIAGFCFVMWTTLLRRHSPGSLSVFAFAVPVFGVFLSALLYGEAITHRVLVGVATVTAGVVIVTRRTGRGAPAAVEEVAEEALR
jgi:drug/metabolite transporter (DMT)-like permease